MAGTVTALGRVLYAGTAWAHGQLARAQCPDRLRAGLPQLIL